jgi:glycosyltransferase involved in cell wall biosynthesis
MSLLRQTYYHVKPYLPLRIRMALRRQLAGHTRKYTQDVWPIKRGTNEPPGNWPGWPGGKQFAFVLTHDVEGRKGMERSEGLASLELERGFRSSFNFIPEGEYEAPRELRDKLSSRGFEIGVHDLKHDGKLYRSEGAFREQAQQINRYLAAWGARGFRSGFMHHNLDWLHDLNVEYDLSTFDTDPFEPQPDGVNTIFPFWVAAPERAAQFPDGPRRNGYLELPYTLAQDSTLFLLLGERSIKHWTQKLDWIAENGGMALINTHPDYLNLIDEGTEQEVSVKFYVELLEYVRSRYTGQFWSALPREVAEYCRPFQPARREISNKRVCMVSYSCYATDNRVMRYAEALANRGDSVDAFALDSGIRPGKFEVLNGVNSYRIQKRVRNEKGKAAYLGRILKFMFKASAILTWRHLRKPYDVVHVHNVPDFLVFSAWFPKLTGARIILDIHDILPEFFASKFGAERGSWYVEQLLRVERNSCAFADYVIIANHLWLDKITKRSVPPDKCAVVLNHVDRSIFYPRPRARQDDRLIAIFPGGLQHHQGLDIAIRAFPRVIQRFPTAEFHIYGDGNMKEEWVALVKELGLEKQIFFFKPLSIQEVADRIANADAGIVPKRADSFGNEAYSTKIMEFMSQGVPVVASRTKIDTFYFQDREIAFFTSGSEVDLAAKLIRVWSDSSYARGLAWNGFAYVAANSWESKRHEYFSIVDNKAYSAPTTPSGTIIDPDPGFVEDPVSMRGSASIMAS